MQGLPPIAPYYIGCELHEHTAGLSKPASDDDLQATNIIQSTQWQINSRLLDVMQRAYDNGIKPFDKPHPIRPERIERHEFDELSPEEQYRRVQDNDAWNKAEGQRTTLLDQLNSAQLLRDRPAIWFPHCRDFRGRAYPAAMSGVNPQATDSRTQPNRVR